MTGRIMPVSHGMCGAYVRSLPGESGWIALEVSSPELGTYTQSIDLVTASG